MPTTKHPSEAYQLAQLRTNIRMTHLAKPGASQKTIKKECEALSKICGMSVVAHMHDQKVTICVPAPPDEEFQAKILRRPRNRVAKFIMNFFRMP